MKKKQLTAILVVFLFINIATFSLILTTTASAPIEDTEPLQIDSTPGRFNYGINLEAGLSPSSLSTATIGDTKQWLTLDDYNGWYFFSVFELRAESDNTEIWVQREDLRLYPDGDPRNEPTYQDEEGRYYYPEITDAQCQYLLEEFDGNIYPKDTLYFGEPDAHDGSLSLLDAWGNVPPGYYYDEAGRDVILVSNFRDAAYYENFRFYIAGFFSSSLEAYMDRNIISIDTHQWYRRVGPDDSGDPWYSDVLGMDYPPVDRVNMYEATIAHEYQHLLHSDYVPGDLLIMNEGFSTFAEYLCGYGVPVGDINYFLATPDNSLTVWGDQQGNDNILADYGQAFMWAAYLNDHFGGSDFLSYYMEVGIPGFEGIQNALDHFGAGLTFDEVFHNWQIANLIHSDYPGYGKYNYETFDLGSEEFRDIRVYDLEDNEDYVPGDKWPKDLTGYGFGHTVCDDDFDLFDTYLVGSYGSDYIRFNNPRGGWYSGFEFDGQDEVLLPPPPPWIKVDEGYDGDPDLEWYSTLAGPEADMQMAMEVTAGSTLTFDTYFDIEPYWDYFFVQVSTDEGVTWTSLANEYTTMDHDPEAYPAIVDNLPGITGWMGWDWITMNFDISAYSGPIWLGFRYMTDWGTEEAGVWVDNIYVDGVLIEDADTTDAVFFPLPPNPQTDFRVTLLREYDWKGHKFYTIIRDMDLDDNEYGISRLFWFSMGSADMVAIITPRTGPADYSFSLHKHIMKHY